ncbi:hypothetical protein ACSYDW_03605 [Paeniglutamicibacter sp. R2-26]|uniref:hypothetical protein n=1 Tax=Paeniglutamicibacter sp. R2-26 TaxID=3144417 RepID=UPI003EE5A60E
MGEPASRPLWGIYRWQNERNERAGHADLLHGVFTTRDAADKALLQLRKLNGQSAGRVRVEVEIMGLSSGYLQGFFEYDPADFRRKPRRSRRPNRHKGFTPVNQEPFLS